MTAPTPPGGPAVVPTPDLSRPPGDAPSDAGPVASIKAHDRRRDNPSIHDLDESTMDPTRHYRWVYRGGDGLKVARAKLRGYRTEKLTKGGVRPIAEVDSAGDGAIVIGDTVLMSCPKTRHETSRQKLHQHNEARLAATTAALEEKARQTLPSGTPVQLITDPDSGGRWRDHA